MYLAWILFAIFTLFYAFRGYRQGVWLALARIVALALGYVAAYFFADELAGWLQANTRIQGMAGWLLSALGLFLAVSGLVSAVLSWLQRRQNRHGIRPWWSSLLGGVTGAVVGGIMGLAVVYGVGFVRDMLPPDSPGARPSGQAPPAIEVVARRAAGRAPEWIGGGRMEPAAAKLSAALAREPEQVVKHVQELARSEAVAELLNDPDTQAVLAGGNPEAIAALPGFQRLTDNEHLRALLTEAGIDVEEGGAVNESLSRVLSRLAVLKTDARVQALLRDPEFQAQLQSGNPAALLSNPRFMELVQIVLNNDVYRGVEALGNNEVVYRWTDAEGKVHYGDKPPDDPSIRVEKIGR